MAVERSTFFDDWLIRFTQPRALNDPFEMRPYINGYGNPEEMLDIAARNWEKWAHEQYDSYNSNHKGHGDVMQFDIFRAKLEPKRAEMMQEALLRAPEYNHSMAARIEEMMNKGVGVLSLCEHADIGLMWSHYGESHSGFVVEFDARSPFFHQVTPPEHVNASSEDAAAFAEEFGYLRPINYQEQRPSVVVTEMPFDTIMTKGKAWEYECEWRLLMPPDYADVTKQDIKGFPLCLFKVPPNSIKAILLGCNADDDLLKKTLTLRERPESKHIRIEKARIDEREFRLHFETVQ